MDVLVEIIMGILRSLFGDEEKPADVSRPSRTGPQPSPRRGPYNYGDERGGQAKTLEQILEEVRQAAAQKKSQAAAPPRPPPPKPKAPPRPPLERAAPAGGIRQRALQTSIESRHLDPEAAKRQPRESRPLATAKPLDTQLVSTAEPAVAEAPVAPVPGLAPLPPSAPVAPAAPVSLGAPAAPIAAALDATGQAVAVPAAAATNVAGILTAIRQAAPQQKRDVARQAMVLQEIFGPPRSRRAHGVGRRVF